MNGFLVGYYLLSSYKTKKPHRANAAVRSGTKIHDNENAISV